MKRTILLVISIFTITTGALAQSYGGGNPNHGGANGFLTVEQENAQMEKVLAERRRQDRIDNGGPDPAKTKKTTDSAAKKPIAQKNVWVKTKKK